MKLKIHFNHKEELWNSWSHAGGILLGVIVGIIFLYWCFTQHNGWATAGIILYLSVCSCHTSLPPPIMPFPPGASGRNVCANGTMPPSIGILPVPTPLSRS